MGVRFVRAYFRFFTALARLTGVLFVLGGAWGLATAGRQAPDDRGLVIIVSLFGLLAGVGLLVASPATPEARVCARTPPISAARTTGRPDAQPRTSRTRGRAPPLAGCAGGRATTYLYPVRALALAPRGPMRTSFGT